MLRFRIFRFPEFKGVGEVKQIARRPGIVALVTHPGPGWDAHAQGHARDRQQGRVVGQHQHDGRDAAPVIADRDRQADAGGGRDDDGLARPPGEVGQADHRPGRGGDAEAHHVIAARRAAAPRCRRADTPC